MIFQEGTYFKHHTACVSPVPKVNSTPVYVYYTYQCTWYYWYQYQVSLGTKNDDAWGMHVSCKL
jgi:hypothetical protein